jgi:FkbM family methyltransferase
MRPRFPRARRTYAALVGVARNPKRILGMAAELRSPSGASLGNYLRRHLSMEIVRATAAQIMSYDSVLLSFERDGFKWHVDAGDEIGCAVYATGRYEGPEIDAVLAWLSRSDRKTVIDLGANVGTTSVPFALAGYHVLAIEPIPETYSMLTMNVSQNLLDGRIDCVQVAISDTDATVAMWTGFASGQAEVAVPGKQPSMTRSGGTRGALVSVRARRLDTLLTEQALAPGDVALVWADVQGSETSVIDTGGPLWRAGVPLYLEVYPPGLHLQSGLDAFLDSVGSNFSKFLTKGDLMSGSPVRPIEQFPTFARSLEHSYSDALLLP